MIFEHYFVTTFSLILTLLFSLYCFGFRANTYFIFVNYGCHISCQPNGCSNNTPRVTQKHFMHIYRCKKNKLKCCFFGVLDNNFQLI